MSQFSVILCLTFSFIHFFISYLGEMVELVKGLEEQEYYHGFIRREEAENILQKTGDYLIRCEMVQGSPSPVLPGVNNKTVRYVLCVLVELEPSKNAVAEWELAKMTPANKWRVGLLDDEQRFFDTIPLLIEEYSNPDKKLELPPVIVAELVKSGMGHWGKNEKPPPPPTKTIEKVQLKKCVKKPKWQLKPADVVMSPGPENLLGTGNYGYVQKGFLTQNGAKIPVAIKAIEDKLVLASGRSQKAIRGAQRGQGGSQKKNDSAKMKNGSTRNDSAKIKASDAIEAVSKNPEAKAPTLYSLIVDTLKEAAAMRDLSHPNVVKMYGVVVEKPPIMVVVELSNKGSLKSYLIEKAADIPLDENDMHNLAVQAAWGLEYLHSKQIIHRDIAARNEKQNIILKISDFGLSRIGSNYTVRAGSSIELPARIMAPESLHNLVFNSSTDIWSFGFLVYEIYTHGKTPMSDAKFNKAYLTKYYNSTDKRDCPQVTPKEFSNMTKKIITSCWKYDPHERPTITEICRILEDLTRLKPPMVVPLREQDDEKKKIIESMKPKEPVKSKEDAKKDGAMEPSKEVGNKFKETGIKMSKEPAKPMSKEGAKPASKEDPKGSKEKEKEKKPRPRTQRKTLKDPVVGSKEDAQMKISTPSKEASKDGKKRVSRRIPRKQQQ